jgi:copper chaperone CopZ
VPDIVVWVTKLSSEDIPGLEAVAEEVRNLNHVSQVEASVTGSAIHVSFEGGETEQEEIEHTIREVGYEIFKVSL